MTNTSDSRAPEPLTGWADITVTAGEHLDTLDVQIGSHRWTMEAAAALYLASKIHDVLADQARANGVYDESAEAF